MRPDRDDGEAGRAAPPPAGAGPNFLTLGERAAKPRTRGFTHVLDKGLSVRALESLVETAGAHIDFVKLGWGTAYVSRGVKAKVALCQEAGIHLCLGGTLLEIVLLQDQLWDYVGWLHQLEVRHVEVSTGAIGLSREAKAGIIRELSSHFCVISEVGSKRPEDEVVASEWVSEICSDMEAGASVVIAEGRESGTVGLYGPDGAVRDGLVEAIVSAVPADKIIFEAPRREQQAWFVRRLGTDVNLGNILPDEVLALETLRLGLRADTLDLLPPADRRGARASRTGGASRARPLIH